MVTHRWWGNKFCKRTCKDAYLRELALGRDKICRWYGFLRAGNGFKLLCPARLKSPCETSATKLSSPSAKAAPESQIAVYWLDLGMIGFFASVALGFAVYAGCPNLKIAVS